MARKKPFSVTIRDVARAAGVSVATVSRYLNRSGPISPRVAQKLARVVTELNYIPHAGARHLASRRTRAVGFLSRSILGDFLLRFCGASNRSSGGVGILSLWRVVRLSSTR
ncbi:MAG: LacI family DNA-binding transcriptional regulator [Candidatus Caldatribacteriaceae bacterium]